MNEKLEIIKNVVTRLNSAGIDYMLTGSMAMAFYAAPRMTRDIDIIIQVSTIDVERIVTLFQNDFYIDAASIRQAIQCHGMFNAIHTDSIIKVDFIVRKDEEYRIEEFSRKRMIDLDGIQLAVAAPYERPKKMQDTPRDVEDRVVSMMAVRTPAQRVRMACSMFEAGRAMLRAGLRQRHGNISESRMRTLVFQTMYKDDFSDEEMKNILDKISNEV